MDLFISASFVAAFVAGIGALFAPCCITVLLPSYLASIFKQRATVFLMTFVYFLGLLAVFLPLGLGASALTQLFSAYHDTIFLIGSLFLLLLGATLLLGVQMPLPSPVHPQLRSAGVGSVFVLGVFSAIATTCCAPVLAGVLALSALPGSVLLGGLYTLAYVLGMVVPLFLIAAVLDRTKFTEQFFVFRRTISYRFFGQPVRLTIANLLSGAMFVGLGALILVLARTGRLTVHSTYQTAVNLTLTKLVESIGRLTRFVPEPVWAILFVVAAAFIAIVAVKQFRKFTHSPSKDHDQQS